MGRQYRSPRAGSYSPVAGGYGKFVSPQVVSSSSTAIAIPNYGVTDMSTWTAGEYVLDVPEEGVRKILFRGSSTTTTFVTVRGSTAQTVSFDLAGNTKLQLVATTDVVIELLGINSTRWAIVNMEPTIAANSTGIVKST